MNHMKTSKVDFVTPRNRNDWYDIIEDWSLIESSFLKQYGIRLRSIDDMPWNEFCSYLSGIMPDTPLGSIVQIRSEENKEIIKNYTKEQKKIRADWLNRNVKIMDKKDSDSAIEGFKQMFMQLAKGDN